MIGVQSLVKTSYISCVKWLLVLSAVSSLGCRVDEEKKSTSQSPQAVVLSELAGQMRDAVTESNVIVRGQKLTELESALLKSGRTIEDVSAEIVSGPAKKGWDVKEILIASGERKHLNIHVPDNYDPTVPTPLVMCYHWSSGDGYGMISQVRRELGDSVKNFILVGPDDIGPYNIDSQRSWKPETRQILRYMRLNYNIDSDRIYAVGFSLGGYAVWSNAAYFGDEFASGISMGSSFDAAPEIPGMWEALVPNTRQTPILYAWGDKDHLPIYGIDLKTQVGTISQFNPRLTKLVSELKLPHREAYLKGVGHTFAPPKGDAAEFLQMRRSEMPTEVHRAFRSQNQGRAFWIECLSAKGPQWHYRGIPIEFEPPETREQAIARILLPRLASLDAKRQGNAISVQTQNIGSYLVWFTEDMIDWTQPVSLKWNGKEIFKAKLEKSTGVALLQYARTRDRQRLWWAGIRVDHQKGASVVTAKEDIPAVVAPVPSVFEH